MAINKPVGDNARKGREGEEHWTKRSRATGQFMDQKKDPEAKPLKGVRLLLLRQRTRALTAVHSRMIPAKDDSRTRFARNPRAHLFTGTLSALGFEKLVGRQGLQGVLRSIGDDLQAAAVTGDLQVTERHRHVFVAHSQKTANAEHNLIHRSIGL